MMKKEEENQNLENESAEEDESQNDEGSEKYRNDFVPKARFDEVNNKLKDLTKKFATFQKSQDEKERERLQAEGKIQELYDDALKQIAELEPKAAALEEYEEALKEVRDAELKLIPKEKRSLVPTSLSVQAQLKYIAENRTLLGKSQPPDIGAGERGGSDSSFVDDLSPEEIATAKEWGISGEDYAKNKRESDNE